MKSILTSKNKYTPVINTDTVLKQDNKVEFKTRFLQIQNYLSEFATEEQKKAARENLGVLSDIVVQNIVEEAISGLKGDVSIDYDTLEKIENQIRQQIQQALYYNTALPDDLVTPNKIGGLNQGTSVSTLKEKTLSQIFDDILFEELQPSVQNPSCSISLKDSWKNNGIYEVGYIAPTDSNFNTSFNRGTCTVVGQPTKYRAGEETSKSITMNPSGELIPNITLGTVTYKLTVQHSEGDLLLTSKGNPASISPNPLTSGSVSSTCTIYGTYPYFCNGQSANTSSQDTNLPSSITPDTKLPLQKWTDTLVGAKFASEADTGTRLEFYFPSQRTISKVEFFNTVSGKWETFGNNNYTVSDAGNKNIQGSNIPYSKLTTQGALNGALQVRFTLGSARLLSAPILLSTGNRAEGIAGFAVNFEPGGQTPLDARLLVPFKSDLINPNTYSKKNYYKGMGVIVLDYDGELAFVVLKDVNKITDEDYSGWQRLDVGAQYIVQIINDLTSGGIDKALSAEQGKVLKTLIDTINNSMGQANGIATLGNDGKVPTAQLPSYVDDVIDCYATYDKSDTGILSNIKLYIDSEHQDSIAGESGKIYVDVEQGYQFRWTGTQFASIGSPTVIGEVTGTAFDGGRGKVLEDKTNQHIANTENPHNVTTEQIGAIPKGGLKTINGQQLEGIGDIKILTTANDVLFTTDLTITADVGVHTIGSSGSKTLPTTGKSVKQVMDMLFAEEKNPTITQPSVNITLNQAGAKEVGTSIIPTYTATLNPGSYQFGPATGVTATSWTITDTNGENKTESSGSFSEFQVIDTTNYKITAQVQHTEGVIPLTNLGNNYDAGKIIAGSKSKVSSTITGYRNSFYGTLTNKNELTSDIIRTLTKSNRALSNGATFNITIPVGALRVVIAYPATLRVLTSVLDVNGLNAQIVTSFTESKINVEGLNSYQAIEYRVYTLDFANPNDTGNTYKVTI